MTNDNRRNFAREQQFALIEFGLDPSEAYLIVGLLGPATVPAALDWVRTTLQALKPRSGFEEEQFLVAELLVRVLDWLPSPEQLKELRRSQTTEETIRVSKAAHAVLCTFSLPFPRDLTLADLNLLSTLVVGREILRLLHD